MEAQNEGFGDLRYCTARFRYCSANFRYCFCPAPGRNHRKTAKHHPNLPKSHESAKRT